MTPTVVLQFAVATALPVIATVVLYLIEKRTSFTKINYWVRQLIIGVVFGLIAVAGTEFGIDVNGATMNVRDAAPISAGLLFGGPAGVIAGVIGGVERWFSVLWGRGEFTRLGCSIATMAVGVFAALLRKYMFDDKKPSWLLALAIGTVSEVLHLTLIFITNIDQAELAINVVRACTFPMVLCNGLSVMLAVLCVTLLSGEPIRKKRDQREISQTVQTGMFAAVLIAFVATMAFTYALQVSLCRNQTRALLEVNIEDVKNDVKETSDRGMLAKARSVAERVGSVENAKSLSLFALTQDLEVSEINVVDEHGIIVASSYGEFVGFDMASGAQSAEFLVLLDGSTTEYVQSYQPMAYNENLWRKYAAVEVEGGFVQVGFNASELQTQIAADMPNITQNRHVGETGSMLICNANGYVLSAREGQNGVSLADTGIDMVVNTSDPGTLFTGTFMDAPVYGLYQEAEGYRIIAILPQKEANFARNAAVLVSAYMEILVFAALFAVIYFLIKKLVVDNIHRVNSSLAKITAGDLNASVDVRDNQEFSSLSDDINQTVGALRRAIDEAAARLDAELVYARTIQRSALPMVFPPFPSHTDFSIYASMDAAKEVGGDFYDFYLLDDDHLAFLIADVSGKGIPASLFMMKAKTLLKSLTESGLQPNEVFTRGNNQLCEGNEAEMFVTAWLGVLDLRTGHVQFANAGHNPPAVAHEGEDYELRMARPNLVLAGMEGIRYTARELDLQPGDTLFVYTDGVTEATNANDELFGEDRLLASLNAYKNEDVESICKKVHKDVDAFVGEAPQFDDITVLAIRYVGRNDHGTEG